MNPHHIDDLIIDEPASSNDKTKKLIALVALGVVVAVIILILWSLMSGPSDDNSATNETATQTRELAPDLIPVDNEPQQTQPENANQDDEQNNGIIRLQPQESADDETQTQQSDTQTPKPQPHKPQTKPATKPAHKPARKPSTAQQTPPAHTQATTKPAASSTSNATTYYVQVGAFKRAPSAKFMQKLKDAGFTFITKLSNGIRKVRIGPFNGYQDAKDALPDIKNKIGVDGLIIKN